MAIFKEFREFFLRNVQVNGVIKPDKETGFTTTTIVNGLTKFNRFLKGNFPTESVMRKFLESITFKLNSEDSATETEQGLSRKATDLEVQNRDDGTGFSTFLSPHQLIEIGVTTIPVNDVLISTVTSGGITIEEYIRTFNGKSRTFYKLASGGSSGILVSFTPLTPYSIAPINTLTNVQNYTMAVGAFEDGDKLIFQVIASQAASGNSGSIGISVGGTNIDAVGDVILPGTPIYDSNIYSRIVVEVSRISNSRLFINFTFYDMQYYPVIYNWHTISGVLTVDLDLEQNYKLVMTNTSVSNEVLIHQYSMELIKKV